MRTGKKHVSRGVSELRRCFSAKTNGLQPMELSPNFIRSIEAELKDTIASNDYVTSGAANDIFRIRTVSQQSLIVKVCKMTQPDIFLRESEALNHIASTNTVTTPRVITFSDSYLVMQDLGTPAERASNPDWENFGRQLGLMHSVHSETFGYTTDNYIGQWAQVNTPTSHWIDFYWENRVACFLDSGKNKDFLSEADRNGIERLVESFGHSVPDQAPSLCHGDLWINNVFQGTSGEMYLIDPAIHFGLPEADLVMTDMYGGFPEAFYSGYRETHELLPDWQDRIPLYQLKELLLMIAQFGDEKSLAKLRDSIQTFR